MINKPENCICMVFGDTGGYRIADLACPIHGINGTDPGDGYWEEEPTCPRCGLDNCGDCWRD